MAKKQHITQCTTTEEDVYILYIIVIKSDIYESAKQKLPNSVFAARTNFARVHYTYF